MHAGNILLKKKRPGNTRSTCIGFCIVTVAQTIQEDGQLHKVGQRPFAPWITKRTCKGVLFWHSFCLGIPQARDKDLQIVPSSTKFICSRIRSEERRVGKEC